MVLVSYKLLKELGLSRFMVYCASKNRRTPYGRFTVERCAVPPHGVPGFHQPDARRVSAAGPALRDRVPRPDGGLADGWETADRAPVYRRAGCKFSRVPTQLTLAIGWAKSGSCVWCCQKNTRQAEAAWKMLGA